MITNASKDESTQLECDNDITNGYCNDQTIKNINISLSCVGKAVRKRLCLSKLTPIASLAKRLHKSRNIVAVCKRLLSV